MPKESKYEGVSSGTHRPNESDEPELKWYQKPSGWICMGCTCVLIVIMIIIWIIVSINDYIEGTNEAREIIDLRNTTITEHVIDFENQNEYINCTPLQSCRFQCSYIKLNLHKHPDECKYDDWMDIWEVILKILGVILLIHCICACFQCGIYSKKGNST